MIQSQIMGGYDRVPSLYDGVSDLKLSKFGVITLLLFGMVIALTGIVCADQPVPAVPETQTLSTVTTADVVGLAMEADAGAWTSTNSGETMYTVTYAGSSSGFGSLTQAQIAAVIAAGGSVITIPDNNLISLSIPESMLNQPFGDGSPPGYTWGNFLNTAKSYNYAYTISPGGIHTGALSPGQVQYTTAYDADIVAQAGHTVFTKSMNIDTRNKVISQSNLNAKTGLTFAATADGGNVVGSENLMIDGAGNTTKASDRMLCPFASQPDDVIPAYCNIVQAGSKYDLTVGSVTTNANDRFVGNDATIPVVLNYEINVKPYGTSQGQIPAYGSAMSYIKAHIQEARGNTVNVTNPFGYTILIPGTPQKAEDIVYNEQSSAQGTITSFTKVIAYQSGKSLL
jgi:hypothetical protein